MKTDQAKLLVLNKLSDEFRYDNSIKNAENIVNFVKNEYDEEVIIKRSDDRFQFIFIVSMAALLLGMLIFVNDLKVDHTGKIWLIKIFILTFILGIMAAIFVYYDGKKDAMYFKAKELLNFQQDKKEAVEIIN